MRDLAQLREGTVHQWDDGRTLTVVRVDKGRRGWTRVLLTPDGLPARLHVRCVCGTRDGAVDVVDAVVEDVVSTVCRECRQVVSGLMTNNGRNVTPEEAP